MVRKIFVQDVMHNRALTTSGEDGDKTSGGSSGKTSSEGEKEVMEWNHLAN
jgi:hypothetical protein